MFRLVCLLAVALLFALPNESRAQAPPAAPKETAGSVGLFVLQFIGRAIQLVDAVDECDRTGKCAHLRERDQQMLADLDRLESITRQAPIPEEVRAQKLADLLELRERYNKEIRALLLRALQKHGA